MQGTPAPSPYALLEQEARNQDQRTNWLAEDMRRLTGYVTSLVRQVEEHERALSTLVKMQAVLAQEALATRANTELLRKGFEDIAVAADGNFEMIEARLGRHAHVIKSLGTAVLSLNERS